MSHKRKRTEPTPEVRSALPLDEWIVPDAVVDSVSQEAVSQEAVSQEAVSQEAVSQEAVSQEAVSQEAVAIAVSVHDRLGPSSFVVEEEHREFRVDLFLTLKIDGYSRVSLRRLILEEKVLVDGRPIKPAFRVYPGQRVEIVDLPPPPSDGPIPEAIPLDVLYEDEFLVAINKPPGMVVHPAKGHWSGTLTSALAHHFQQLSDAGGPTRPGIVHRLDRETSGVILIAKTNEVHFKLCAQFEARTVQKTYIAIVTGTLDRDRDRIVYPIGHHPYQREKMAIRSHHPSAKEAETMFEVVKRFPGYCLLKVFPKTGRTHQIRVHLAHVGCPVLCDRLYAGHGQITRGQLQRRAARGLPPRDEDAQILLDRQALHAARIEFSHPKTGVAITIEAPIPEDLQRVLAALEAKD